LDLAPAARTVFGAPAIAHTAASACARMPRPHLGDFAGEWPHAGMTVALPTVIMTALILLSAVAVFAVAIIVTRVIEHVLTSRLELWVETIDEPEIELDERDFVLVTPPPIPLRALAA
jgi:hypothetical protein